MRRGLTKLSMREPRFSIIIPTRERADTLYYALLSAVDQDFDDYEVVVYDNCSSAATRDIVEKIGSTKVRYFRSGYATGDDGLLGAGPVSGRGGIRDGDWR